jgi:hypothetical protein
MTTNKHSAKFYGRHGRALGGLLVYVLLFAAMGVAVSALIATTLHPRMTYEVWPYLIPFKGAVLVAALTSTAVLSRIERTSIHSYWGARGGTLRRFTSGAVVGFALFSASIGLIALWHGYSLGTAAMSARQAITAGIVWIVAATIYAVGDSIALFGYPLHTLRRWIGFAPAAVVIGLIFVLCHIVWFDASVVGFAAILTQGLFLCATMWHNSDISFTAGIYAGTVFAQDFVFSVADSGTLFALHLRNSYHHPPDWLDGASAGPKASLMSFVVYLSALIALVFIERYGRVIKSQLQHKTISDQDVIR